jgi:hypothetical protein
MRRFRVEERTGRSYLGNNWSCGATTKGKWAISTRRALRVIVGPITETDPEMKPVPEMAPEIAPEMMPEESKTEGRIGPATTELVDEPKKVPRPAGEALSLSTTLAGKKPEMEMETAEPMMMKPSKITPESGMEPAVRRPEEPTPEPEMKPECAPEPEVKPEPEMRL